MKVIIAGSREGFTIEDVRKAVDASGFEISLVISGGARGVDKLGEQYAKESKIELAMYPAYWDTYGKSAGYRRNAEMVEVGEALIALWDGSSKGTGNMIDIANKKGLQVYVWLKK